MRTSLLMLALTLGTAAGCGGPAWTDPDPSSTCESGMAVVALLDGALERVCGCQETSGDVVTPPAVLDCTVNSGDRVLFFYGAGSTPRQVESVGSPAFPSSAPHLPNTTASPLIHPVVFDAAGTYEYRDALSPSVQGRIVVL